MSEPQDDQKSRKSEPPFSPNSELPEWIEEGQISDPPEWLSDFPDSESNQDAAAPLPKRAQEIRPKVQPSTAAAKGQDERHDDHSQLASITDSSQNLDGSPPPPRPVGRPEGLRPRPSDPYSRPGPYTGQSNTYTSTKPQAPLYTGQGLRYTPPTSLSSKNAGSGLGVPIAIMSACFVFYSLAAIFSYIGEHTAANYSPIDQVQPSTSSGAEPAKGEDANELYSQGEYGKAIVAYSREIADKPDESYSYYMRGICYTAVRKFALAVADLTKAINLDSSNNDYYYQRASAYCELKQFRKALADMNQAIKMKPDLAGLYSMRSYIFSCMHSPKSALVDANKAVALAPSEAVTHEQKAGALLALNQFRPAAASYTTALKLNPADPANDYAMRSLCYLDLKDYKNAFADAKRALSVDPNCAPARDVIANLPASYQNQLNFAPSTYTPPMQSHTAASNTGSAVAPVADKWALVIGVGRFQDPSMNPLPNTVKDARDLCKYLTAEGNFSPDHVRLLTNEHASLRRVKQELNKFLAHVARPDDLVVIYFSSHGSSGVSDVRGDNYIVLSDTQGDDLFSTGLEMQSLINVIKNRIIARRILLVLDCCFSGNTAAKAIGGTGNFDARQIAQGTGQVVVCSSAPNQVSWESGRYSNGVFTRQLIEGLRSKGNRTTINEAFKYTRDAVTNEVHEDHGTWQTPVMNGAWRGPEMRLSLPPASPRPVPQSVVFTLEPDDSSN